jgi:two-component system, NtrC family, sensor kinase
MKGRSRAGRTRSKAQRRKRPTPKRSLRKAASRRGSGQTGRVTEMARLTRERDEALEREKATAEVLRVISSSGALEPVFEAILENAARICEAKFGVLFRFNSEKYEFAAEIGTPPQLAELVRQRGPFIPAPNTQLHHVMRTKQVSHTADYATDAPDSPPVRLGGARSTVDVPMLRDGMLTGSISIYRQEVRPFTDKQIALLQNFANQAVIAIENTRLLGELRQSLEQQTATSDVLRAISSSPGQLEPVFQAMLENATRICEAGFGFLWLSEGAGFRCVALHGVPAKFAEIMKRDAVRHPGPLVPLRRVAATKQVVHSANLREDPAYAAGDTELVGFVDSTGAQTHLLVPMLKDNEFVGAISIYRTEVRLFTDKQVALVTNFAAQAVIAIENTRLLNELRQSLQQQTATADVLKIISRSAFDLQAVLDTLTASAARLCRAELSAIRLLKDGLYYNVASHGFSTEHKARMERDPIKPEPGSIAGRVALAGKSVHLIDAQSDPDPGVASRSRSGNIRTLLGVPLQREGMPIGVLLLQRRVVQPFTENEIGLAETFADQAVIAIENVRLFEAEQRRTAELTESLEQQTATSDVLRVISSSPGDLNAVFTAMLESATRICDANFANLELYDNGAYRIGAMHNAPSALVEMRQREPIVRPGPSSALTRAIATKQAVHVLDYAQERTYKERNPGSVYIVELAKARTLLVVPMLKEDEPLGVIAIYRTEVRPFTGKQIELLSNFAAQAVIAIENARLLNELRESLQQQTATSDVLKVISRSTFDLQSVLDTLVESAARLCEADMAATHRLRGAHYEHAASYGIPPELHDHMKAIQFEPDRGSVTGRTVLGRKVVHVHDVRSDPEYTLTAAVEKLGARTTLGVPLLREGVPIGVFILMRRSVRPFTDKQIELLSTFADQAVIAIENVRLFEAEQQRTRELAKSLEELHTTQDRLVQTQKLASLGQLTAGIAHEIKNPLNFVNNFSSLSVELIDELEDALGRVSADEKARNEIAEVTDTLRGNLDKIAQHGKRADSIVKNMLLHSREGSGERRLVNVNALVEESLNLAYHGARAEKQSFTITLERSFDPEAGEADVFPQEITRVLLNLISNGFYAAAKHQGETDDKGHEPTLAASTKSLGDSVEIRIRDNGTGIPPEVKEKMFNPFFTTKPAGEGTGLGLSISHDIIVKQHSGSIEVETEPGEFTEFRIILPRTAV